MVKRNRNIVGLVLSLVLLSILPVVASAQRRGRGWARGHDKSWKCRIFVNCHDARDGRLDGRGPRANRVGFRNRGFVVRDRRRFRNFDNEDRFRERRFRMRNRNFENDQFFRQDRFRQRDREFPNNDLFRGRGRGKPGR